jgi:hypothetical protein
MTFALLGLGACYVMTALALRAGAWPGRLVLAVGGVATILVAANPEPCRERLAVAYGHGGWHLGLAERVLAGVEAAWPLAVILTCYPW